MTQKFSIKRLDQAAGVLTTSLLLAALVFSLLASSTPIKSLNHAPFKRLQHGTSSNWSGYATFGAANTYKSVSASWKQPTVTCATRETSYSSFWVGLDGYNDSTVEQIGTEADCYRGHAQYYVWYEMYPRKSFLVTTFLRPGDNVTASVTAQANSFFSLRLTDSTTGRNYVTTQRLSAAQLSSAEVVTEAPWSGGTLPLANFGAASFTNATANGQPLGSFNSLDPITMVDPYGMKSTPSAFDSTKANFSVTWSAS